MYIRLHRVEERLEDEYYLQFGTLNRCNVNNIVVLREELASQTLTNSRMEVLRYYTRTLNCMWGKSRSLNSIVTGKSNVPEVKIV